MSYIFIANWKMNFTLHNTRDYFAKLALMKFESNVVIAPPSIYLAYLKEKYPDISLASQDISACEENYGPFTGEVSASMLKEAGIGYAIIGHSERRRLFKEDIKVFKAKVENCVESGIIPIICLGESKEQRASGQYLKYLEEEFLNLAPNNAKFIIAYEPIWAIGTGVTPEAKDIEEISSLLYSVIGKKGLLESSFKLVYGGSVNAENVRNFLKIKGINGVLVGNSSLKVEDFINICKVGE